MTTIRLLKADEIELRVQTLKENGFSLLPYKNARVDMAILDEVYGPLNWQREHEVINGNLFCTVSIYDEEKKQWIKKQDVGVESYTEKEKGQASDSFKRACTNVGIGRELYTAPKFIWINAETGEVKKGNNGKLVNYGEYRVKEIAYNENREIIHLVIIDQNNKVRYTLNKKNNTTTTTTPTTTQNKQVESPTTETNQPDVLQCSNENCTNPKGRTIDQKVYNYSVKNFGKPLCRICQKVHKQ